MTKKQHNLWTHRDHILESFLKNINSVLSLPSQCSLSIYLSKTTFIRSLPECFSPIVQTAPKILRPSGNLPEQTKGMAASALLSPRKCQSPEGHHTQSQSHWTSLTKTPSVLHARYKAMRWTDSQGFP